MRLSWIRKRKMSSDRRIRPTLFANPEAHRLLAIAAHDPTDIRKPVLDARHIFQVDRLVNRLAPPLGNDELLEFRNRGGLAHDADVVFFVLGLDAACRQLFVLCLDGIYHVLYRELVSIEFICVYPYP